MPLHRHRPALPGLLVYALISSCNTAHADVGPDDEIYSPRVEAGEFEIEARYYHLDGNADGANHARETRLELGYSPTDFWRASVSPVIVDGPRSATKLRQIQIENVFALPIAAGAWPDMGLFVSYEIATVTDAHDELVLGPIFEERFADVLLSASVFADRAVTREGDYGMSYAWQIRWDRTRALALGLQGFGEHEFGNEDEDEARGAIPAYAPGHRAGPALFGDIPLADDAGLNWQLGLLWGLDDDAADHTLRLAIAYER